MAAPFYSLKQVGERPASKFTPNRNALSCAGQGCPERTRCVNYRRHAASRDQRWASFDIERRHFDNCLAFERI